MRNNAQVMEKISAVMERNSLINIFLIDVDTLLFAELFGWLKLVPENY